MKELNSGFSLDDPEQIEESLPSTALRHTARTAARVGETLLGMPGDIAQGALGALKAGEQGSNWLQNKLGLGGVMGSGESAFPERAPLPTSEEVRTNVTGNIAKSLPKDYLEAKTPGEQFSDEFFSDLTSMATPVPGMGKLPIKRALAVSGLGNLGKWASKDLGASEGTQTGIKIGTMLAATMAGRGKLNQTKKDLYKNAQQSIEKEVKVKNLLEPISNKWELAIEKGASDTPSKQFIKKRIDDIRANTVGNRIGIENVLELKKDWNELKHSSGIPNRAEPAFNEMMKSLHSMINDYGKTNPKFYDSWKQAEDIHQGLTKASATNKWMQKHVTPLRIGGAAASILLGNSMGLPHAAAPGATALAGVVGTKYGVRAFEALKNSPTIRKYYADTVASAVKRNVAATVKNAQKLDRVLEEKIKDLEPKEGFSID
jgi:hypothetical protein